MIQKFQKRKIFFLFYLNVLAESAFSYIQLVFILKISNYSTALCVKIDLNKIFQIKTYKESLLAFSLEGCVILLKTRCFSFKFSFTVKLYIHTMQKGCLKVTTEGRFKQNFVAWFTIMNC